MYMGIAAFLFAGFFLNVFLSASGGGLNLSEVAEMLILTTSVLFFVAAILKAEAAAKENDNK